MKSTTEWYYRAFIQSLNEMIDDQGKRLAALRYRVPHACAAGALALLLSLADFQVGRAGSSDPLRCIIYRLFA